MNVTVAASSADRLSHALGEPLASYALSVVTNTSNHESDENLALMAKLVAVVASRLAIYPEFISPNSSFTGVDLNQSMLCWVGARLEAGQEEGEEYIIAFHLFPPFWAILKPFYCSFIAFGFAMAMRGVSRAH